MTLLLGLGSSRPTNNGNGSLKGIDIRLELSEFRVLGVDGFGDGGHVELALMRHFSEREMAL